MTRLSKGGPLLKVQLYLELHIQLTTNILRMTNH